MKINIVDNYTVQVYDYYFPGNDRDGSYGAPGPDEWWKIMEWCRKNEIVCRRGRGTSIIFQREEDITAFMLRWA